MNNKYRLQSNAFEREDERDKIAPQKIFFLSIEGNVTEKEYFQGISANRRRLGINAIIDVQVLRRGKKDTNSAPQQVIELLEEYIRLRNSGKESLLDDIPKDIVDKYGVAFIEDFLSETSQLTRKQENTFVADLMKVGYDIHYRKYLQTSMNEDDAFGILIDRDMHSHSIENMFDCIQYCRENGYACYITNPCFEFWLLLHLSDVKEEYADKLHLIKENKNISRHHTFVSNEVSKKAHHGKSGINFRKNYMLHVHDAILRAKDFAGDENDLVENIGCNIYKLFEAMMDSEESL